MMNYQGLQITRYRSLVVLILILLWSALMCAQTETVLHSFGGVGDGYLTTAGVVFDQSGNLYGTLLYGPGTGCDGYGCGAVFELMPNANGTWNESLLYTFNGSDGGNPQAPIIFDNSGNLYGTTRAFGDGNSGTVFELTSDNHGAWAETTLYAFTGADGADPLGGVVLDNSGHIYGTTSQGGTAGDGVVYSLTSQSASGARRTNPMEAVLYSFQGGMDGSYPAGALTLMAGNLYGTTLAGGDLNGHGGFGTVFELTGSTETILHQFGFAYLQSGVIFGSTGNIYGTTYWGGSGCSQQSIGCGTVYQLTPSMGGTWTESVIYNFMGPAQSDGANPIGGLIADSNGNLYGTTFQGGMGCSSVGCGTVFKLTPGAGGTWTETVLYKFQGGTDGSKPAGTLTIDSLGNLYGTTYLGGTFGRGVVFKIAP